MHIRLILIAHISLLVAVAIWGGTFVATKICLEQLSPFEIIGFRFSAGLPILAAMVVMSGASWRIGKGDMPGLIFASLMLILQFVAQAYALTMTSATNTAWLVTISPLAIAILGAMVLKEKPGPATVTGIAIATAGVIVLVSKGNPTDLGWIRSIGDWLVLFSALNWAFYAIAAKNIAKKRGPLLVTLLVYIPMTLIGFIYIVSTNAFPKLADLTTLQMGSLIFLAIPGMIAQWLWNVGLARLDEAAKAGLYIYLEPVTTTLIAVPLLNESFGWGTGVGAVLIILGVQWAQRK